MIIPENYTIHKPQKELLSIINNKTFDDKTLLEIKSEFHNIKIIENEIGRFLHYDDTYQAGQIKTSIYQGNLPYINYFLLPYFYNAKPKKILLIGLGSGIIVSDIFKLFDGIQLFDIVDIEENIFDIAKKFFNFKKNKSTAFYLQDAITFLKTTKTKYDLIIVDVANNYGIDKRFISEEYFALIKSHMKNTSLFVSNMCSSPDFDNPKNKLFQKLKNIYTKSFYDLKIYKGDYSDKIYYKSFFNIDERVIDITNIIFIASKSKIKRSKNYDQKIIDFQKKFKNIDIQSILSDEYILK